MTFEKYQGAIAVPFKFIPWQLAKYILNNDPPERLLLFASVLFSTSANTMVYRWN